MIPPLFDYINSFHDPANSIATIVATRVLPADPCGDPVGIFNFIAAMFLDSGVARSISKDYVDPEIVTPGLVPAGLLGAIG